MDSAFAKSQLTKHGWKDEDLYSTDETGIKDPIKVKLKHDSTGIGHDHGEQFTFHWWDHMFNKAASGITIETKEDGVEVKQTTETGRISSKKRKTYDSKAMLYGQFIKGATLAGDKYQAEPTLPSLTGQDSEEEEGVSRSSIVPDNEEEIFKQCGGRTAHKAARHGHKLNGKLVRIQQQEQELLERMQGAANHKSGNHSLLTNGKVAEATSNLNSVCENGVMETNSEELSTKKKKRKKSKKGIEQKENEFDNVECCQGTVESVAVEKVQQSDENSESLGDAVSCKSKKSKKRKKRKNDLNQVDEEECEEKIKKKQKTCDTDGNTESIPTEETCPDGRKEKSKKKKEKKRSKKL